MVQMVAILKTAAILNLKIPKMNYLGENNLKFMYCLTLYVSFEGNYDSSLFLYYFWRPFCFMLIISNCPRLIASQPKYFANWVYWQTKSTEKKTKDPKTRLSLVAAGLKLAIREFVITCVSLYKQTTITIWLFPMKWQFT